MRNYRVILILGVILLGLALVSTALAAANATRQSVASAELTKAMLASVTSKPVILDARPPGQAYPVSHQLPTPNQPAQPSYTPYIQRPKSIDWQALEDARLGSKTASPLPEGVLSDFGEWDSSRLYAPTVLRQGDLLSMWYTGFAWDGSVAIGLATSSDGIVWDKSDGNPFFQGVNEPAVLQLAPDDLRLYACNDSDGSIYLYESSDGGTTWSVPTLPVFSPSSDPAAWDRNIVCDPVVLYTGGIYYMFYEGGAIDDDYLAVKIGLATSPDGISWTRAGDAPVLDIGAAGDWDERWVLDPMVIEDEGDWQMWFRGVNNDWMFAIGYATSPDGETWTKHSGNPVFTADPEGWDNGGPAGAWVDYNEGTYTMWYTSNRQIGYATSQDGISWERPLDDAVLKPSPLLYAELNYGHDWLHLYTLPNEPVTVTLTDAEGALKGTIYGKANDWGDFWSSDWLWIPEWQYILAGDSIFFEAAGLAGEVDPIGDIQGVLDVDNDLVTGSLNAAWIDEAPMTCDLWSEPYVSIPLGMIAGDGGSFECDFGAQGVDLQPGMPVAVIYDEPDGDRVINIFESPWMRVNYGHDWVGGNYAIGHTFNITVQDSAGAIKATATVQSELDRGWSGDGFETRWEDWSPSQPDIVAGDYVVIQADDGFEDIIQVGKIGGTLDLDEDKVSGRVYAAWLTEDLVIECHPWGAPGPAPSKTSLAGPDGDPPYTCDWDVTEWDILPGQDVAVMYIQPENRDRVINVFRKPAPNLAINKWVEGSGLVMQDGPVIFNIWYANHGEAVAESFRITDTLPDNTTYVDDTSGVPVTLGAGWAAWEFGDLAPGEEGHFYIVLENTAQVDDILANQAEIFTEFDFDDGNDHAYADAQVIEGGYNLWVDKNPAPGDPTPGDTYQYQVNVGNQDAVASGPVTLTETLPEGTSLVGWYSMSGFQLWEQVSYVDNELVLSAPSFAGYWGDSLRLTLEVDLEVEYGTQLTNTVVVTTPGDIDPYNDWFQDTNAWVSPPRVDGQINMHSPWGQIYPGEEIVYPISFSNDGNVTFDAVLTNTLPDGMSYIGVGAWMHGVPIPFEPVYVDDEIIVWEFDALPPGEWVDVDLRLAIEAEFLPGTPAINCITLEHGMDDASPWNNLACVEYVIPEAGPNLRVDKYAWWNWEGQIQYYLEIHNTGSVPLDNVLITDTFPLSTTWNGSWWANYGPWITATGSTGDDQIIFWLDYMNPGDNAGINYQADLDSAVVGEMGLIFTNLAEAPVDGDVYEADNTASVTVFTGADIFIDKWLGGGEPLPGEIITYTVEFGNLNQWPWQGDTSVGSHITDTLPEGATFLYATAPWDDNQTWEPESVEGNVVRWGWGPMWGNSTWRFNIVVQLPDDLEDGAVLTNHIEAYGDNPEDFDFFWENNHDSYSFTIDLYPYEYYLPMNYKYTPVLP